MTNKIKLFVAIIFSTVFISCSSESERNQELELEEATQTEKIEIALRIGLKQEKDLVLLNYNKLDDSFKKDVNVGQYHKDLQIRYDRLVDQMKTGFEKFDRNKDAETQVIQLRESLMEKENIPDWYMNFKIAQREKMKEIMN